MKKIKYLFGFLLVGIGLLFNQSFGIDVEVVSTQFDTGFIQSNYSKSYSYLYRLNQNKYSFNYGTYQGGCFGNGLYFNKQLSYNHFCAFNVPSSYGYGNYFFNASIFDDEFYTGGLKCVTNDSCFTTNLEYSKYNGNPYLLLGTDSNFGKNAFYMDCYFGGSGCSPSPKYFFGGPSYFQGYDWLQLTTQDINQSIRFFYNTTVGSNNISNINIINPNTQPATFGWEYFTNQTTRTNFGYIIDTQGWKGKHFGSMGMGYSFVSNKSSINSNQVISWDDLLFTTIYDSTWSWVKSLGGVDLVNRGTDSTWAPGVLILRKLQYSSQGDEGVIVISKNPNNTQQLLYQEFSCQTNNFQCLAKGVVNNDGIISNYCPSYIVGNISTGTSSYNPCLVLSQGLLTYNGDINILPFQNRSQTVNISDYPILSYLFDTSSSMLGGTYTVGDNFCIGDDPTGNGICFGKVSSSDSIKDNYLNPNIINSPEINTALLRRKCLSDSDFYINNIATCSSFSNSNPSNIITYNSGDYEYQTVCYYSGDVKYCFDKLIPVDFTGDVYVDGSGNSYYISNNTELSSISTINSINYISGFIDEDGIFSGNYFDSFFNWNSDNLFFSCPFPSLNTFGFITKLKFGNFYPLMPINCMLSAFNVGSTVHYFDDFGVFPDSYTHSLFFGDSKYHKILFRFFDVLLSFGLFLILSSLYRLFNK